MTSSMLTSTMKMKDAKIEERKENQWRRAANMYKKTNRVKERSVAVGDRVFVRRSQPENKLAPRLLGPFIVTRVSRYNVSYQDGSKEKLANKDDVRVDMDGSGGQQNDDDAAEVVTGGSQMGSDGKEKIGNAVGLRRSERIRKNNARR